MKRSNGLHASCDVVEKSVVPANLHEYQSSDCRPTLSPTSSTVEWSPSPQYTPPNLQTTSHLTLSVVVCSQTSFIPASHWLVEVATEARSSTSLKWQLLALNLGLNMFKRLAGDRRGGKHSSTSAACILSIPITRSCSLVAASLSMQAGPGFALITALHQSRPSLGNAPWRSCLTAVVAVGCHERRGSGRVSWSAPVG